MKKSRSSPPVGMNIFIGSSKEASETMKRIARCLRAAGHTPLPWNKRNLFITGQDLFAELVRLSKEVDGAVFVFAEDDTTWSRGAVHQIPRDNVLLEYGLFVGSLGRESVCAVVVGKPKFPSDLLGVLVILSPPTRSLCPALREWAERLYPGYVKRFGSDLATHLARRQTPVRSILLDHAPELMSANPDGTIRAVCGDKGRFSPEYYGRQFKWVRQGSQRDLKRLFVKARKDERFYRGFSKGEVDAILLHWEQRTRGVQIRWVYEDDSALGGLFASSLGFAVFGKSWILHWGLRAGLYYDHGVTGETDPGIGDLLRARFNALWEHGTAFDTRVIRSLRNARKRGGHQ